MKSSECKLIAVQLDNTEPISAGEPGSAGHNAVQKALCALNCFSLFKQQYKSRAEAAGVYCLTSEFKATQSCNTTSDEQRGTSL